MGMIQILLKSKDNSKSNVDINKYLQEKITKNSWSNRKTIKVN